MFIISRTSLLLFYYFILICFLPFNNKNGSPPITMATAEDIAPPPLPYLPGDKTIVLARHHPLIFSILQVVSLNQCCRENSQTTTSALASWARVVETIFRPTDGCARAYSRWADRDASKLKKRVFSAITFFNDRYHDSIRDGLEPSQLQVLSHQLQRDLDEAKAGRTQQNNEAEERQRTNDREERADGMMPPAERGVPVQTSHE